MGPFVPEFISEQLNLVVALFLGMGFGFVLEQAGFSSSRRLAGVFYGYDFTVLRVFFTAAVTAMSGVILLSYLGFLDMDAIFVNPLWLRPAIVGGIIMGLGFVLGGYCPGTSVCAASIGKVDALFFVGGGLLGVSLFGEFFPLYHRFFESTARGPVKVFTSLGMSQGLFAFLVIVMAVGAFYATTRIEKKVAGDKAPSQEFPVAKHMAAGVVLLALGFVMMFMPDYKTRLVEKVSSPSFQSTHSVQTMVSDELAFRIVDHEPHTRILDLRPAASFQALALPGSINLTQSDLFGRDLGNGIAQRRSKKVIVAENEKQEREAYWLMQELGYENLAILEGGFPAFRRTFLHPDAFVPAGNRWDEDVRKFREEAQTRIPQMIEAQKASATKTPKAEKKIQGGC
jgi:rhodanese-related sulfurtransferase